MAKATKEETQSLVHKERKRRRGRKQDDEQDNDEPPTINGVPIPEFLWDAPDHYRIFGA